MKNIRGDFVIDLGVLNNTNDIYNLRYGWDVDRGILSNDKRQIGTPTSWGLVYNRYDLKHTKLVVREQDIGGTFMAVNSVKELDDGDLLLFGGLIEGSSISIASIRIDPDDPSSHSVESRYKETDLGGSPEFGIILEKEGLEFKVYASDSESPPKDQILSYEFSRREWDEVVLGSWGYDAEIRDILGFRRIVPNDFNILQDYEIRWQEGGMINAWIRVSEDILEYAERGNKASIYLREFDEGSDYDDLYGENSIAFGGIIIDISERDEGYEFDLSSYRSLMDREMDLVILEDLDIGDPKLRDYFQALEDVYDHYFDIRNYSYPSMSSSWHKNNDRVLSIKGDALSSEQDHLYFGGMQVRIEPVLEMTQVDIEIYEAGSGENKVIKSSPDAEEREEDIINEKDFKKISREDIYINLLKLSGTADDQDRWIVREKRFDQIMNLDIKLDIEKDLDLRDFSGSQKDLIGIAEDYLDMQEDGIFGDVTIVGHHHNLSGMNKQGSLEITDSEKDIIGEECRIKEMIINKGNTEFKVTQSPLMERKEDIDEIRESIRYADIESVYDSCSESKIYFSIEEPIFLQIERTQSIQFLDSNKNNITNQINVKPSQYRGFIYLDVKINPENIVVESESPSYLKLIAGQEQDIELPRIYSKGIWFLNGEMDDDIQSETDVTIALMQDLIIEEPRETTFCFGEPYRGWGDLDAGGGHFAKPKSKLRIEDIR